jgi:hypothetical protein
LKLPAAEAWKRNPPLDFMQIGNQGYALAEKYEFDVKQSHCLSYGVSALRLYMVCAMDKVKTRPPSHDHAKCCQVLQINHPRVKRDIVFYSIHRTTNWITCHQNYVTKLD